MARSDDLKGERRGLPGAARKLLFGSIRLRLIALVLVSVLPSLGVITYSGVKLERQAVENAADEALDLIVNLAATHQQTVESTRQLVMTLSKLPEVRSKDVPACSRLLAELLKQNRTYANILIADARGLIYASATSYSLGRSVSGRKYFLDAAASGEFSAGEYVIGLMVKHPVFHFAYPILGAGGTFEGVVIAAVDLSRYGDLFQVPRLPAGSSMVVSDHRGIRLFGYPGLEKRGVEAHDPAGIARMSDGPEDGTFAAPAGGETRLFAYKRFSLREGTAPYLFMEVSISERQALAGARRLFRTNLTLLGLAFFIALASALFLGNHVIVRRLSTLVAASREWGKGRFEARTGAPHGPDELGLLARSFDEMAQDLEQKESDRARAQEALRESEEKFRLLFEKSADPTLLTDGDVFTDCNEAAFRLMGCVGKEQIIGLAPADISPLRQPDGRLSSEKARELIEATFRDGVNHFEWMHRTPGGREFWIEVSQTMIPIQGKPVLYTIWKDISKRKEAERALQQSRLHLLEAVDLARIVYWEVDPADNEYILNDPFFAFFGTTAEEEGGYHMSRSEYAERFVHPDDRPVYFDAIRNAMATEANDVLYDVEHRVVRKDGQVRHIVARRRWTRDASGWVVRRYGANQDITERKRAEEELREKETRFRMIFEGSPIGMVMADSDYRFVRANPAFCKMLGIGGDEVASLTFSDITHPAHLGEDAAGVADVVSGKIPLYRTEKRYIRKDGEIVWGSTTVSIVRDKDGKALYALAMIEDITQRRQAEEEKAALQSQLLHAQKMEAVGQLAGGVAHDFNNILMAMMGYGNLLQMKMEASDPLRMYVDHIITATGKAAHLTQSLLTFGRKQVMELKACKVAALINDAEKLLRRLLPEDIELQIVLDADPTVMADMMQIDQVLMNLATNARDAMPRGGRLRIEATTAVIDRKFEMVNGFGAPGEYALICVTDSGSGMDEKTREKIFEPFFTTKEVGKGTGLGLAIVYGIVKQHGGYITLDSEPGKGAAFRIYLPAVRTEVQEVKKVSLNVQGGCETILVADDNADIRGMASDILGMAGYHVIEAVDGADAVEKFTARPDDIQLVVLDVVMPVKGGKEAFDAIKAVRTDVRALFMSGYTGDVILDRGLAGGTVDFLAKPVSPEGLLVKVRQVLDRQHA